MFFAAHVSRSPLKRVSHPGFKHTSAPVVLTVRTLHKTPFSRPCSTSTPNSGETPLSALPPLPEESEWKSAFNPTSCHLQLRERVSIRNPQTARILAEGFTTWTKPLLKAPATGAPKVIIEAFPGPGALTRALLTLPRDSFDKLLVLEEQPRYLEYLKPLEEADDRIKVFPYSGYNWNTYSMLDQQGWLDDVPKVSWGGGVHPSLQFISHVPLSVVGEQLMNQFLRCIPDKTWLFKYGRVPVNLVMGKWLWQRSSAGPTDPARCKLSVIAEVSAELGLNPSPEKLMPYEEHFHPTAPSKAGKPSKRPDSRKAGHPMVGINLLPHEEQVIGNAMLEKWDYCLRRLFVLKGQSVKVAIGSLAPGSQALLKPLTDPNLPPEERVDIKKQIRQLDVKDWALILRAFNNWPFAPEDLLIHDGYHPSAKNIIE